MKGYAIGERDLQYAADHFHSRVRDRDLNLQTGDIDGARPKEHVHL